MYCPGIAPPTTSSTNSKPAPRPSASIRRYTSPNCPAPRSEEHTSELQSQSNLVCRLLLEKKKKLLEPSYHYDRRQSPALDVERRALLDFRLLLRVPHATICRAHHLRECAVHQLHLSTRAP